MPTGSVRILFGYMSTLNDAHQFLKFIRECFVQRTLSKVGKQMGKTHQLGAEADYLMTQGGSTCLCNL